MESTTTSNANTNATTTNKTPMIASKVSTLEQEQPSPHRVLAMYKFVDPHLPKDSLQDLQSEIESKCRQYRARGTLLLATEGINGTICYPFEEQEQQQQPNDGDDDNNNTTQDSAQSNSDDPLLEFLTLKFPNPRIRISKVDRPIFARLKIKLKSEIVTMRNDNACPIQSVGTYVPPNQWNDLISDPDCLVVDTRNEYEVQVGTFRNAINPHTDHFTEFPNWMEQNIGGNDNNNDNDSNNNNKEAKKTPKKIAMFCTGGIRCEKATNACMKLVPKDIPVYHLEGGILAYLDNIRPEESLFDGECYVFDQRIAVTYKNEPSKRYKTSCHACRHPLSAEDTARHDFVEGLSCRWCVGQLTEKQKDRFAQRQKQIELARNKGMDHIHDPKEKLATATKKQRAT